MSVLETFHFIRPAALLLLIPAALVTWSLLMQQDPVRSWRAVISPRLLGYLAIRKAGRRSRIRPVALLGCCWLLGILALAGPSWEREPTPFTEDQAALFIVLKVTPEMLSRDVQPSRLQRSAQKINDLLALRPGSKTGLIAYAGSAHLVMPLTSDASIISYFASELTPEVMPVAGDEPLAAIELARARLQASGLPGSVLLIADHVDPQSSAALAERSAGGDADVHVLAVAAGAEVVPPAGSPPAPALDREAMRLAARSGGGSLVLVSPDDSDVTRLNALIARSIAAAPLQEGERWRDAGYYLLLVFTVLVLLFFRRGGAVALQR
jgi:Ca-activated chloride channel family protein